MNKNKSKPFVVGIVTITIALIIVFIQQSNKNNTYTANVSSSIETSRSLAQTTFNSNNIPKTITNNSNSNINNMVTNSAVKPTMMTAMHGGEYTLAQVAAHNNKSNCWTTINGGVYNVTSWIGEHPGGAQAIISLCGIDGSDAYNGQHGGERRPANELASFKIGILK